MTIDVNIKNSTDGLIAGVTKDGQLRVQAEIHELQHEISTKFGRVFQAIGTASLASGTVTALHIRNDDPDRNIIISFERMAVVGASGGTAFPNASNYFSIRFNRTVSSGGSAVTPVNVNRTSGRAAVATVTQGAPTLAGTALEFDRWHPNKDGDREVFNKQGSVVLGLNDTLEVSFVGNHTSGTAYARVTFMFLEEDE